jgi:hypothetical protein
MAVTRLLEQNALAFIPNALIEKQPVPAKSENASKPLSFA